MVSILTKNKDATLLASLSSEEIARKWKTALLIDVGDVFRSIGTVEYWECNTTGFRWYAPQEAAGGAELYMQLEKFDWYYKPNKWEFSAALRLLVRGSSVLEVGIGEGYFLQAAQNSNFGNFVGVELNPKSAERARGLGFKVYGLSLKELREETSERFDAICSFQVLEHVPDPLEFLEGMIGMLRPGGRLLLSVPNAGVMMKIDPRNQDLLNLPPHHMGHWTEQSFRRLEKILPLKVRSIHREPLAACHVSWIMNGYLRNYFFPSGGRISRLFFNRYTMFPFEMVMKAGLRRFFYGHTLLAELSYDPS